MSDTAISPGVGAVVVTGNAPVAVQSAVVQPGVAAVVATGNAAVMGLALMPGVGSVAVTGRQPSGGMWAEAGSGATVWTVLP